MFRPIEKYVEGAACANCWGVGKTFGDVKTPKRILVTGSGFAGACAVCNGTFILNQNPIVPCSYAMDDGTRFAEVVFGIADTLFTMEISGGPNCYTKLEGLCVLTSTDAGKTVTIEIEEPPTPEYKIAIDQNISPSLQTHFLNLGASNGDEVLILAHRPDRIKLHVKYTPDY